MTDKNKEIRVRKLQVKRGSQAEKELDHNMFLSKNFYIIHVSIFNEISFSQKEIAKIQN